MLGFFIICLVCLLSFKSETEAKKQKTGDKKGSLLTAWFEGPVRYIITKDEEAIFASLTTDQERSRFINRFWSRRDPSPGTPENEFRYEFWQRVVNANFLFAESTKPGWKTDRGKVYIIMGPANEIEEDPNLSQLGTSSSDTFRGITRWIYQGTGRTDIDPIFVVAFYKDAGGEYRLSYDPKLNSVFYDRLGSYFRPNANARIKEFQQTSVSELAVTLDLGNIQQLPPQEEIFSEIVTDKEYFNAIPLKTVMEFHSRERDGKTFASLTIAIKKKDIPSYGLKLSDSAEIYIIARLIGIDDPNAFYNFPEGSFAPSPLNEATSEDDLFLYQMRASLAPGKYTLLVGVFDRTSEFIGSYRETIDIREIKEKPLILSGITLADRIDQKEGIAGSRMNDPFWFGDLFVIPRLDSSLRKGDPLTIFFQVTFAADLKEAPGLPDEKVEFKLKGYYQFFKKNEAGEFVLIGKPIPFDIVESSTSEPLIINRGRVFETVNWPAGSFKLVISVSDEKTNETDSQEIYFSIS